MMLLSLCACSGDGDTTNNTSDNVSESEFQQSELTSSSETSEKQVDLGGIKKTIISELKIEEPMDIDTSKLTDLYGIEAADVAESACFITSNGTFPEEVIMIKAKDDAAQKRIVQLLETRIDDVKIQSESYDPDNYAIAQKCKVITQGEYVAMFISASHEKMESIFIQSLN